jgi:hypothetical protein
MLWYDAYGLANYWRREIYTINEECRLKYNSKGFEAKSAHAPLRLKQLYVPFVMLLVGYLIAFFQFARENMVKFQGQIEKVKQIKPVAPPPIIAATKEEHPVN